jgi:hypothetical protein
MKQNNRRALARLHIILPDTVGADRMALNRRPSRAEPSPLDDRRLPDKCDEGVKIQAVCDLIAGAAAGKMLHNHPRLR